MIRALLVVALLAGCGGSATTLPDSDEERLATAMCEDLENGMSLFQMHSQAVSFYLEIGRSENGAQLAAAELEDLATRQYCPEFRDEFEATFVYEDWIAD